MNWFKMYHGVCSDGKWPIIAKKASTTTGIVVSVWVALLETASQAEDRGCVEKFDPEGTDALFGYEDGTSKKVFDALNDKGLIADNRICSWEKRQLKSNGSSDSAERVRRHRERKRLELNEKNIECNACNVTVTPCNALRNVTVTQIREDKIREEKIREEEENKKHTPLTPQGGERECQRSTRFIPPTPDQVQRYCDERHNGITGSEFCDFYASKGWMVGKSKMKDWQAAIRTWERSRQKIIDEAQDKFRGAI